MIQWSSKYKVLSSTCVNNYYLYYGLSQCWSKCSPVDCELFVVTDGVYPKRLVLCVGHSGHSGNVCGINEISQTGQKCASQNKAVLKVNVDFMPGGIPAVWSQERMELIFFLCIYFCFIVMHPVLHNGEKSTHLSVMACCVCCLLQLDSSLETF